MDHLIWVLGLQPFLHFDSGFKWYGCRRSSFLMYRSQQRRLPFREKMNEIVLDVSCGDGRVEEECSLRSIGSWIPQSEMLFINGCG